MNGDLPVLDDDLGGTVMPHAVAARLLMRQGRNIRRTDARGIINIPLAIATGGLRDQDEGSLSDQLAVAQRRRVASGTQTSMAIGPGTLHAERDLGIPRARDAGPSRVQDGADDPVLARLLAIHDVARLARVAAGLDARWRMHERSAHPYVNYVGLPAELPPFILRPHSTMHASLVEIRFGRGVVYSNLAAFRMISLDAPLPSTIVARVEGVRVSDVVGHPALDGLVFAPVDDRAGPCTYVVEIAGGP